MLALRLLCLTSGRQRDRLELALFVVFVQLSLWSAAWPLLRAIGIAGTLWTAIVGIRRLAAVAAPLKTRGPTAAWTWTLGATCVAAAVIMLAGIATGGIGHRGFEDFLDKSVIHWLTVKLPMVTIQQIMLHGFVVPLLIRIGSWGWWVVVSGAILFSTFHLPNPLLMLLTLAAAGLWIILYRAHGRLLPLVVSHFALAIMVAGTCGEYVLNMRVGASCVELFPRRITTADHSFVVLPHALTGEVDSAVQRGSNIYLRGWAIDQIHRQVADRILICIGDRSLELPLSGHRLIRRQIARRYDAPQCPACGFELVLPASWFRDRPQVAFFAGNHNGWFARLNCWGRIAAEERPPPFAVAVFPRAVQGRVRGLVRRDKGLQLVGWAADRQNRHLPEELWIEVGDRTLELDLQPYRCDRPDLARAFGERWIGESGFAVPIPAPDIDEARPIGSAKLRVFGKGKNGTYSQLDCQRIETTIEPPQTRPMRR